MRRPTVIAAVVVTALAGWTGVLNSGHLPRAEAATGTTITIDGSGGAKVYQGVGAVLGGGGNARYLMDYPDAQRGQILDYLFKPGYGASLQLLKLEIGGGTNSTDGAEPSIQPSPDQINCSAGYEFAIAQQAVQRNSAIKLYGLQWTAPSWVSGDGTTLFTGADINYLLDWLHCATGGPCAPTVTNCPPTPWSLPIGYLGGWNEDSTGSTSQWYSDLRTALDNNHYGYVKLVAGDLNPTWEYASATTPNPYPAIAILGAHDVCHYPTEPLSIGVTDCDAPEAGGADESSEDSTSTPESDFIHPSQPLWASELGGMDAGAQNGCADPCAGAMDRALARGFHEAALTGYLEWPVLDAMPEIGSVEASTNVLPYENRGLITADQPWSGNYTVNAMTWAIAQFTDFVTPPTPTDQPTDRWVYEDPKNNYLQGQPAQGAYVTLIHQTWDASQGKWVGRDWTTVIDTTTATANQSVTFNISGGSGLAGQTVHVWSSNFNTSSPYDEPQYWLWHRGDTTPQNGTISNYTLQHGFIYTFTTSATNASSATSQAPGSASANPPPPAPPAPQTFSSKLLLPSYTDSLATSGNPPAPDDEPQYLDTQDGSFELQPCQVIPPNGQSTCTEQTTVGDPASQPVFWHPKFAGVRFPYAIIGDGSLRNYTVSTQALLRNSGASAGVIGRFTQRFVHKDDTDSDNIGHFDGYVFDVSTTGAYQLIKNTVSDGTRAGIGQCPATGSIGQTLDTSTWYKLSLSMSDNADGTSITATITSPSGQQLFTTSCTDPAPYGAGLAGIEAGFTNQYPSNWPSGYFWPHVQYSDLSITPS